MITDFDAWITYLSGLVKVATFVGAIVIAVVVLYALAMVLLSLRGRR